MLRCSRFALALLFVLGSPAFAEQAATSGTFVLHKFARPIGTETYSIATGKDTYTLSSHFLFTDRGTKVPLETTFVAATRDMAPRSFTAKGKPSRQAEKDDSVTVTGDQITIRRSGKSEKQSAGKAWFVVDGYSPVAMQEQMMRWWLKHGKPAEFTAFPSKAAVRITASAALTIASKKTQGYTVTGLIWGQESLWMDEAQNLVALVSIDAEFDHFEAVREEYAKNLDRFIAEAVKADLANLKKLSANARMAPARRLAIVGATIEDSVAPPIRNGVILIQDGVIQAVGSKEQVTIPADATVLEAAGKFAVPGLWDMHAHYEQVEWGPIYLAAGVTTARDVGNEFDFIRTLHDELDRKQDPAIGPHLEFAGVIDGTGALTIGVTIADTPEQAREWVERYAAAGAKQIKIYSSVKPEIVKAITSAAHAKGMTVTGHIPEGMTAIQGVNYGMDQINHISYELQYSTHPVLGADGKPDRSKPPTLDIDGPRMKDLISTLQAHHTVLDPTAALYESFSVTKPLSEVEPGVNHLPAQLREALDSPPPTGDRAAIAEARRKAIIATLRALHEARVPIVAGTDQAIPGYSLHRELELYVEAGFTPLEALQAATIESARAMGVEKESGSLETGKRSDVLLLNADPLADIHNTRAVWKTVAAGAIYDPAPLWQAVGFLP